MSDIFTEHLGLFTFFKNYSQYSEEFSPDISNIANLVTLGNSFGDQNNYLNVSSNSDKVTLEETYNHPCSEKPSNGATVLDGICEGKFVSPKVINLSKRHLSKVEICLLSEDLKFIPTPKHINKALIKEELETYGRKIRLIWHYRNEEREITINPFKQKSEFDLKRKDASIEIYLSRLEAEIFSLDKKLSYWNLTKEERKAGYSLRDDTSIIIEEADKGSGIAVSDREDYLAEAKTPLKDKDVCQELKGKIAGPLEKIVKTVLRKVREDISDETLHYFLVNSPKLGRFYLLPKIHKRLYNVTGRPVISNSEYYTENISAFLEYHLKPMAEKVTSYIKDTNNFLRKLDAFPSLPDDIILCAIDVVGLYPNISHENGLVALRKTLDAQDCFDRLSY